MTPFSKTPGDGVMKDASTVLLLRERETPEVFMVERHRKSGFMAGAYVFPGGKVDAADSSDAVLARIPEASRAACRSRLDSTPGRPRLTDAAAAGVYVAACRELFEEAGVMLAKKRGTEDIVAMDDALSAAREDMLAERVDFHALLEAHDLVLAVERLEYWAHWVTPSAEPRRYDTRFFLVRHPDVQAPRIDQIETTKGGWHGPRAALDAQDRGEVFLPPPTLRNIEQLASFDSVDAALEAAAEKKICAIQPKVELVDQRIEIVLPWDPAYETIDGEALEGLESEHPMADDVTRIVVQNNKSVSVRRAEREA